MPNLQTEPESVEIYWRSRLRRSGVELTYVGLAGLCLCALAALMARMHWVLDLFTSFALPYFVCALAAFLLLAVLRAKAGAVVALLFALYFGAQLVPYLAWPSSPPAERPPDAVRVLLSNVYTVNRNFAAFRAEVQRHDPDILCVQETDDAWAEVLSKMAGVYPHQEIIPQPDNFGIALLSRWPLHDVEEIDLGQSAVPALIATVETPHGPLRVLTVHTFPPVGSYPAATRNRQLEVAARMAAAHEGPFALIGDLNTTPWSPHFRDLIRSSGLSDARGGRGILPTWPANAWYGAIVPVDHVLTSPEIQVHALWRGHYFGSDHLPVIADLLLPPEDLLESNGKVSDRLRAIALEAGAVHDGEPFGIQIGELLE